MTTLSNTSAASKDIIFKYSAICAGVAVQPIPFADIFILTPIQALMGKELANAHGIKLTEQESKDVVKEIIGVIGLGIVAQNCAIGLYKVGLPFLAGFTTIPLVFGLTYGIGHVMKHYFEAKQNGRELSQSEMKALYVEAKANAKAESNKLSPNEYKELGKKHAQNFNLAR